jgi:ATP-binding cassette subfamily C protein CydC
MRPAPPRGPTAAILARHARAERRLFRRSIAAAVLGAVAGLALLGLSGWFLTGAALTGAALAGAAAGSTYNYLLPSAGVRLAAVVRTGTRYAERLWAHAAALGALAGIRSDLFAAAAAADPRDMAPLAAGDATARLTGDIDALEDDLVRAPALPAAIAAVVVATAMAAIAGPWAALLVAAGLAATVPASAHIARRRVDVPAQQARDAVGALKLAVALDLGAAADIHAYGLTDRVAADLARRAADLDRLRLQVARGEAMAGAAVACAGPMLGGLVVLVSTAAPAATALAALAPVAATEFLGGAARARARRTAVRRALARLDRLVPPERPARTAPVGTAPAVPVLGIGAVPLAAGARLGIAGPSGSGKTRLLETLAGLRSDAPQPLTVTGQPVTGLAFEYLAGIFALSAQDPLLIAGTVADNLRLADPGAADPLLWQALETACLADAVRARPDGLGSWVGDGGSALSGGERKRLSIARALLGHRPWLLLDEPAEGLDPATEDMLATRLEQWLDRTGTGLILTTHRPLMGRLARQWLTVADGAGT